MKIKFITVPDPLLRKKSRPINEIDRKIRQFIKILKKALMEAKNPAGVGLSAVQIGKSWRIFLARKNLQAEPQVFINPQITWQSEKLTTGVPAVKGRENNLEGCLSLPDYYGLVHRAEKIKLKWQTERSEFRQAKFSGFLATVIQHELDHLNGILFIDRVLEQKSNLFQLAKEGSKEVLQPVNIEIKSK